MPDSAVPDSLATDLELAGHSILPAIPCAPLPKVGALPAQAPKLPGRKPAPPRSPLRWFGGKCRLAKRLVQFFPAHHSYCEVFGGALHVLFRKEPSPCEVFNDLNVELINFWRVIQTADGLDYLCQKHSWCLYSRAEFERMKHEDPGRLTEHERAWRFLYLNRACFAGKNLAYNGSLSYCPEASPGGAGGHATKAQTLAALMPRLQAAHQRLARAQIECLPYEKCLELYDRERTFFYLDPPYYGYEQAYGKTFARADYARLADILANIRGKFLLSINDCSEARRTFARFNLLAAPEASYSVNRGQCKQTNELLFANYDLPRREQD